MSSELRQREQEFLLEEYKHIAMTHDHMRDVLVKLFNYFLLLSAFPFTVAGLMSRRDSALDIFSLPRETYYLFVLIGVADLFLALSMVDARFAQYRYARTVNLIRRYYVDVAPGLSKYLFLPT